MQTAEDYVDAYLAKTYGICTTHEWRAALIEWTKARDSAIRAEAVEECARCVPTNWLDELLTGKTAGPHPLGNRGVEQLLRGVQDRIRALIPSPPTEGKEDE